MHCNTAESFSSLFERARIGVFHYFSHKHLSRHLNEFGFRWEPARDFAAQRLQVPPERLTGITCDGSRSIGEYTFNAVAAAHEKRRLQRPRRRLSDYDYVTKPKIVSEFSKFGLPQDVVVSDYRLYAKYRAQRQL